MHIFKFFKTLQGSWHYTRTLTERSSGTSLGSVQGIALFSPVYTSDENNPILHYKEEGTLISGLGKKMAAHQEYFYIYKKKTNSIEKHFAKNSVNAGLFYVLNIEILKQDSKIFGASGAHMCLKDHYQAKYQFLNFSQFTLEYMVTGPTKNYISNTLFEKLPEPPENEISPKKRAR